jgi:hypothetical protein
MLDIDTSKPLSYTSNTFHLLLNDIFLFIKLSITWPITAGLLSIVLPFRPYPSGKLDELYPSAQNLWAVGVHGILFIAQFLFLVSLVAFIFMGVPAILYFAYIIIFVLVNIGLSNLLLNRGSQEGKFWVAGKEYAANPEDDGESWVSKDLAHEGEKWVFINGVAVGSHWLTSNLQRLAITFRRPILAVHNPTYGIPFDVIECILQRTFAYPTLDIRKAYAAIATLLGDPNVKKLVLIAHSQGAIEAGMVLDWLYATMSREQVAKLEVFTFGNAGNHWNCPVDTGKAGVEGRVIRHMEHYANSGDWVARFGILHFRQKVEKYTGESKGSMVVETSSASENNAGGSSPGSPASPLVDSPIAMTKAQPQQQQVQSQGSPQAATPTSNPSKRQSTFTLESRATLRNQKNRFVGRLFLRPDSSGHQMNQHYFDHFFPLEESEDAEGTKRVKVADVHSNGTAIDGNGRHEERMTFMDEVVDQELLHSDDTVVPVSKGKEQAVKASVKTRSGKQAQTTLTVKELSRLWQYRDGKTPEDWVFHGRLA